MARALQSQGVLLPNPENAGRFRTNRLGLVLGTSADVGGTRADGVRLNPDTGIFMEECPISMPVSWLKELDGPVAYLRHLARVRRRVRAEMMAERRMSLSVKRRPDPALSAVPYKQKRAKGLHPTEILVPGSVEFGRKPLLYQDVTTVYCRACRAELLTGKHAFLLGYMRESGLRSRDRERRLRLASKLPAAVAVRMADDESYCPGCVPGGNRGV